MLYNSLLNRITVYYLKTKYFFMKILLCKNLIGLREILINNII